MSEPQTAEGLERAMRSWSRYQTHIEEPWVEWLWRAEQATCPHNAIECESFVGPESGTEYFHCKHCGWTNKVIYY